MSKVTKKKYNIIYEDKYGLYRNALLSEPPTERTKKELGIVHILDMESVDIIVNDTDIKCQDVPIYKNPK
jgi:hypothetical protein